MALETVFYPQDQWGYDQFLDGLLENDNNALANWVDYYSSSSLIHNNNNTNYYYSNNVNDEWDLKSSPEDCTPGGPLGSPVDSPVATTAAAAAAGRRKRRRTKNGKNKEELENQRMTHIAVERNRRKQMNEYLAVIRSLMPASYVQRGDQASIVGGAINFVKELEQQLQTLEAQKRALNQPPNNNGYTLPPHPFGEFFTFPQYSIRAAASEGGGNGGCPATIPDNRPPAMAEIEVTMVESHANLKILSKKQPRQLLKMVAGLQCLWLTILHLNVTTTLDQMVFYTVSVKLEDGCRLSTVDEIADAINCLFKRIEEEALCPN